MSTDLLFEHFATLATAPDGIKELKLLILRLALSGNLVSNNQENDKQIQWQEKRLDEIVENLDSKRIPISESERDLRIQGKNKDNLYPYYGATQQVGWIDDFIFDEELVLLGEDGVPFLDKYRPKAYLISGKSWVNNHAHVLRPIKITSKYLLYFLNSVDYSLLISGTTRMKLNQGKMNTIKIKFPPIEEQKIVIQKVDQLLAICDELEARQHEERAGCLKLGSASLAELQTAESPEEFGRQWAHVCDAFNLILDCPENVAVLRQTILQLAVQGRLVRQESVDEPAGKLVDRIRKEKEQLVKDGKIGKTKLTPEIESEEIPYPIPKNWIWTRLDHITYISTGSTPGTSTKEYYIGGNIPWVTSSLTSQKFIFNADTKITEKAVEDCSLKIYPEGTLLVALYGQGKTRGQVSELGISATINQACSAIVFWKNNEPVKDYLKLVLTGNYEKIRSISAGGAQPNLNGDKIKRMLIPLPPLAEQHRIVAKVDALMALCDALESRLKERSVVQGKFANAIVKNVADA